MLPDYIYNLIMISPFIYGYCIIVCMMLLAINNEKFRLNLIEVIIGLLISVLPFINIVYAVILCIKLMKDNK